MIRDMRYKKRLNAAILSLAAEMKFSSNSACTVLYVSMYSIVNSYWSYSWSGV